MIRSTLATGDEREADRDDVESDENTNGSRNHVGSAARGYSKIRSLKKRFRPLGTFLIYKHCSIGDDAGVKFRTVSSTGIPRFAQRRPWKHSCGVDHNDVQRRSDAEVTNTGLRGFDRPHVYDRARFSVQ